MCNILDSIEQKLKRIRDKEEQRTVKGLLDIIENQFGFNFIVSDSGKVIEVQMVSAGLVSIPRGLTYLKNLYRLHLQSNKIRRLRNLDKLESLEILDLSDNQITDEQLSIFEKISGLKSLDLSYNKIKSLRFLISLKSLESLKLTNNQITEIPELHSLSKLKFLDLSNNPITSLENIDILERLIQIKLNGLKLNKHERLVLKKDIEAIKEYCSKKKGV